MPPMKYLYISLFLLGPALGGLLAEALPAFGATAPSIDAVYDRVRHDPVLLQMFLQRFPKGADLHNHLAGAVYAENLLRWAGEDGLCISLKQGTITAPPCAMAAHRSARGLEKDEAMWNAMVDALSMRNFVPTGTDRSGHDHFFATFGRFDALEEKHQGDMLAEALKEAARDHVQYVEIMIFPALMAMIRAGKALSIQDATALPTADEILQPVLPALVAQARSEVDRMEKQAQALLQCHSPQASPACKVTVRYLFQSVRIVPPAMLYSQLAAGYILVRDDPRFVGVNIVAPEDNPIAMRDYDLHMQMFAHLNTRYPGVKLSLHAGELTPALVPPEGLEHHIRAAITVAGARRIGHGVDILWENDPEGLLAMMAHRNIMVEINLSSNDEILGIKGNEHPFSLYRHAGVPVALSTDDEGVSRGSLTQEYRRAAERYGLHYDDLVQLSRTGLEYAFLPGKSLWQAHHIGRRQPVCQNIRYGDVVPAMCRNFLAANPKAALQWQLEEQRVAFEAAVRHDPFFTFPASVSP